MKQLFRTLSLALCTLMLTTATAALAGQINLSAAASMKDAFNDITTAYKAAHPGTVFRRNYAASGALAGQIEQGAPADLYISANVKWMKYLEENKLVELSSVRTFAFNELVFAGTTAKNVTGMNGLLKLGKIGASAVPKACPLANTRCRLS